ncbi:MAG: hypothetical protein V1685_04500 [Parcubacteria group bacterium]
MRKSSGTSPTYRNHPKYVFGSIVFLAFSWDCLLIALPPLRKLFFG